MQRSALCRSRRELSNAYFVAKFGLDTAENEPCQVCPTEPSTDFWLTSLAEPMQRGVRWSMPVIFVSRIDAPVTPSEVFPPHFSTSRPKASRRLASDHTAHGVISNMFCKMFANNKRTRSRLYQNEILQELCVQQHFSSSTRFASFCTAAISKFSQKKSV